MAARDAFVIEARAFVGEGASTLYDPPVPFQRKTPRGFDDRDGHCQLEMADCNGLPDLRVGPVNAAHDGYVIQFEDWKQFERLADAVESARGRLQARHK